jgi:hypothetical protein
MAGGPLFFLDSVGAGFGAGFLGLTGLALFQFLHVRDLATAARQASLAAVEGGADPTRRWRELAGLKSELEAASSRAALTTSSVPTLALLGTCLGFFYAILTVSGMDLASSDPLAILSALMDGGIATALATTVAGQGVYFLMGQIWSLFIAGPRAEAATLLDEGLALLRQRLDGEAALSLADGLVPDPTDAPWPVSLAAEAP